MDHRLIALACVLRELGIDPAVGITTPLAGYTTVQYAVYLAAVAGVDLGYHFGWVVTRDRTAPTPQERQ